MIEKLIKGMAGAEAEKQWATYAKIIIDIAKVSGIYVEKQEVDWLMTWDGKVENISDERLHRLTELSIKIAYGDDANKIAELKRRALGEPQVIDITLENNQQSAVAAGGAEAEDSRSKRRKLLM